MSKYYICEDYNVNIDPNKPLFCDIETHGLYLEVCLFQMYQEGWKSPIIVKYPDMKWLKDIVAVNYTVWYNASYDLGTIELSPFRYEDLYYAAKTAYPLLDSHSLDSVEEHLGIDVHDFIYDIKEHLGISFNVSGIKKDTTKLKMGNMTKSDMQKSFASAACKKARAFTEDQLEYAAADTVGLAEMWHDRKIRKVLRSNKAYAADIQAAKDALVYQYNGMPVAKDRLESATRNAERNLNRNMRQLPPGTNVKSPKLKDWLGTANANEQTLKGLELNGDTRAKYILGARKFRTRLQDLNKKYAGHDRVRTFFNAAGAITGRFTSTGGDREGFTNIQNINRDLKYIFGYAEDSDRVLVNADYSTAELIAGCSIMKVPSMREWILDGMDIHKATAVGLAKTTYEEVTKAERQAAKAVNFGLLFGMGVELFRDYAYYTYGVKFTLDEAQEAKDFYYRTHPGIKKYHQYVGKNCKRSTFTVETALGRVAGNRRYTELLNIPVQGSIAEATKLSIHHFLQNNKALLKDKGCIVNTVHDSIVLDIDKRYINEFSDAVQASMIEGWREVSKSDLFHYQDLPMGVEVTASHRYDSDDFFIKEYKG